MSLAYADARCANCHAEIVASYLQTGMGRSLGPAVDEAQTSRQWRHPLSGRELFVEGGLRHGIRFRHLRASYRMEFAIGSGNQGKSYAWRQGDALFQSPIAWYTERRQWDFSPGYQEDPAPDFYRPITTECLFCHAGAVRPIDGTQNRYQDPPFLPAAISCDRCHGDGSDHIRRPLAGNIVNPSRLPAIERDSVCEACHLSGEARIPNPGKDFLDFRPGRKLEDVFTVYVPAHTPQRDFKVVSHSEQLAASRCAQHSKGRLWCVSCHDPHRRPAVETRAVYYRAKCLACHPNTETRHQGVSSDDCTGCHMPRRRAYDGGHTAFTDHQIRRRGESSQAEAPEVRLRAWREPASPLRTRNLALAYIASSEKLRAQPDLALARLQQGVLLLNQVLASGAVDGAVAQAAGLLFLKQGKNAEAVRWFRFAVQQQPTHSLRRLNLAAALLARGDRSAARAEAVEAIRLEPLLEGAYALLAEIEPARASYWKAEYLKRLPQRILP